MVADWKGCGGGLATDLSQPLEQGLLAPVLFLNQQFGDDSVYVSSRTGCSLSSSFFLVENQHHLMRSNAECPGWEGRVKGSQALTTVETGICTLHPGMLIVVGVAPQLLIQAHK